MIKDRIRQLRESSGLKVTELGKRIGITKSAISQIESGMTKEPKATHVHRLAVFFGVSTDWLITGRGSKKRVSLSEEEYKLILAYRNCDAKTKNIIRQISTMDENAA